MQSLAEAVLQACGMVWEEVVVMVFLQESMAVFCVLVKGSL